MHRFSIGRNQNCDVVLHGATVSRRHAYLILWGDGSIQFEDANSTNGSHLVEGDKLVRISSTYLQPAACLKLGNVRVSLAEIMENILVKIRQDRGADQESRRVAQLIENVSD